MQINEYELDYSKYKLPTGADVEELKKIVCCSYDEAMNLSEDELFNRVSLLREYLRLNECDGMYEIMEHYMAGNMEDNYRYTIRVKIYNEVG